MSVSSFATASEKNTPTEEIESKRTPSAVMPSAPGYPMLASEIDPCKLTYSNPTAGKQASSFRTVYVNYDGGPLIVQTPWLDSWDGIALPPEEYRAPGAAPKYAINGVLRGHRENPQCVAFHDFLHRLDEKVIADASSTCSTAWFKKKCSREICDALYTRQLKQAKDAEKYPPSFKIKVPCYDGVWKCDAYEHGKYDAHVEGDLSEIVAGKCRVRVLMKCSGIWLNGTTNTKFGVSWTACQIEFERTDAPGPQPTTGYQFRS